MSDFLYISSVCKIDSHHVFKDSELLFQDKVDGNEWLLKIYKQFAFDYPKFYKMDSLSKLGWLATEILLTEASIISYPPEDVGIVLTNKNSSLDTDIRYYESVKSIPSPALFVYTLPNIVMGEISIRHQLKGENALFVSEHFDGAFIHQYVQGLFEQGSVQCCICGWLEFFGGQAEAVLYLVEKSKKGIALPFTEQNI
ncbi:MAG: hypothetical protein ACXWCG_04230, partial [Flavitalea sp.]